MLPQSLIVECFIFHIQCIGRIGIKDASIARSISKLCTHNIKLLKMVVPVMHLIDIIHEAKHPLLNCSCNHPRVGTLY